jgi:uncharacterized membrane protein
MATELLVAVFPSRSVLTKALDHLMSVHDLTVKRAAIVAKATTGETILIGDDISADEAGIAGGTLGAAMTALGLAQLGALALPGVGVIISLGAGVLVGGLIGGATGRFAANLLDSGFKSGQIEALADRLYSGHPALVLEMPSEPKVLDRLRKELTPYRAQMVERLKDASTGKGLI